MYEMQTCTIVAVGTQGCCTFFLHSSTEAESIFPVLGSTVVDQCRAIADLHETCTGVAVGSQGRCRFRSLCHQCWAAEDLYERQCVNLLGQS